MEQNKVRTYLLYAIGEILLVVIGILIALQVNNWNEERKANKAEKFILMSLKQDFEIRYDELIEFKRARKQSFAAIQYFGNLINNPATLPPDSINDVQMAKFSNALSFNDQFKTMDMLFSTGMISELSNPELKRLLISWPQQVEEMMEEQRSRLGFYRNIIVPFLLEYIALREVYNEIVFRGYNLGSNQAVKFKSNYSGLINDPIFERSLAHIELLLRTNDIDSDTLIKSAERIIFLLQQEIDKN